MMYMKAHGNKAGPSQRPFIAATLSSLLAGGVVTFFMAPIGVLDVLRYHFGLDPRIGWIAPMLVFVAGGMGYAWIFNRAANDLRSGWLFGLSFGFLVWMLGPATIMEWVLDGPFAVGRASSALMALHLLYGLLLGLIFPLAHSIVQDHNDPLGEHSSKLTSAAKEANHGGPPMETPL